MRPANLLDVTGLAGVIIGSLSDSPLWWMAALLGIGLLIWSDHVASRAEASET